MASVGRGDRGEQVLGHFPQKHLERGGGGSRKGGEAGSCSHVAQTGSRWQAKALFLSTCPRRRSASVSAPLTGNKHSQHREGRGNVGVAVSL